MSVFDFKRLNLQYIRSIYIEMKEKNRKFVLSKIKYGKKLYIYLHV